MAQCPSCGAAVTEAATTCPQCGAPVGHAREALRKFAASSLPFRTPLLSSLAYVPLAWILVFLYSQGWVMWLIFAPHYLLLALAGTVILGFVLYLVIELLAGVASLTGRLNYLRLLAACGVLSFALGFLPVRVGQTQWGVHGLLLEDYAGSLIVYAVLLYVTATLWWAVYWISGRARA